MHVSAHVSCPDSGYGANTSEFCDLNKENLSEAPEHKKFVCWLHTEKLKLCKPISKRTRKSKKGP